ncbi:MAG: metal-sensitive transcriptional regulator [Candidatus Komeilibacteria bacterium]
MTVKKQISNKDLSNRFNRLRGQLEGLQKMLADERECSDVLTQLAAVRAALSNLGLVILQNETSCLKLRGKERERLNEVIARFFKTN